jgi:hypothetical protein
VRQRVALLDGRALNDISHHPPFSAKRLHDPGVPDSGPLVHLPGAGTGVADTSTKMYSAAAVGLFCGGLSPSPGGAG